MMIKNCKVINSTITSTTEWLEDSSEWDNGDKVGGIVGYLVAGDSVINCLVENTTIKGYRDLGGIVGYGAGTVTGNTAKDVTIIVDKTNNYKGYTKPADFDANAIVGEGTVDASNTATNVEVVNSATVADSAQLNTVLSGSTGLVNVELAAGTYDISSISSINNKDITITGTKDTVVSVTKGIGNGNYSVTFEGVTVNFTNNYYTGFQHSDKIVYKDCTINGTQFLYAPEVEFINCVFENKADYCVWTYGASDVTFTNCTFNTGGKAILVYNEVTASNFVANITLNDCKFNDDDSLNTVKGVVETGTNANNTETSNKYNITFTNCEVNGFALNDEGIATGSVLWGNKNSMDTDHLNVVVDGNDVY